MTDTAQTRSRIAIRDLRTTADLRATSDVYRDVFGISEAVNARLLTAIGANGGVVIGAFDEQELVGFVYGIVGRDTATGEIYHYSQTAAVRERARGRGVGRMLKLGQRDRVLGQGIDTMRWSFDPFRTGNARFNLDMLGARGRWFVANMYGDQPVGEAAGRPSDRIIVEWNLHSQPPESVPEQAVTNTPPWGETAYDGTDLLLALPRSNSDPLTAAHSSEAIRERVAAALQRSIADGYRAVSCLPCHHGPGAEPDAATAIYRLRRPSDTQGAG